MRSEYRNVTKRLNMRTSNISAVMNLVFAHLNFIILGCFSLSLLFHKCMLFKGWAFLWALGRPDGGLFADDSPYRSHSGSLRRRGSFPRHPRLPPCCAPSPHWQWTQKHRGTQCRNPGGKWRRLRNGRGTTNNSEVICIIWQYIELDFWNIFNITYCT